MENSDHSQQRFTLNKSVSIGDVLVCLSLLSAGIFSVASLDKRISLTESNISDMKSNFLDTKIDAKETQRTVEALRGDVLRLSVIIERNSQQGKKFHGSE